MAVTLTTTTKNWLAINAGSGSPDYCFAPSGVSYTLPDTHQVNVGSTGDVVNAFWAAHAVGLDTEYIIAGTNYNEFKAINSGVDIGFDDIQFAYTNDGDPVTELTYCAPPANIISTALTTDTNICAEPCTISATVTWINDGALPGIFSPGVSVDGGTPTELPPEPLAAGTTVSHTFIISELTLVGSPHNICASPGTHCETIVVIDICSWIVSRGGWQALTVYDIMQLVSAYLGQISLEFTVTVSYIMGAVAYYLDRLTNGNGLTGCAFT